MSNDKEHLSIHKPEAMKLILIVEDDASIGEMLVRAISEETPHQALLVPDSMHVLEIIKEYRPDLIILDYHLPRMNGLELYDRLQAMEGFENIPTILTTAGVMQYDFQSRHLIGMSKPVDLNKLLDLIEELLAR
ncbi:MAG: response regulator [Chloroflexota bacterium]|nr:response regulator [Chloroflexota bacterium]